jgi:hypothetical protein
VVIEAAGLQFVAERAELPLVSELRVDVETRSGRSELVFAHPTWTPPGKC